MLHVAHETRLNTPDQDGVTWRAQLEASAARGNPHAIERLTPKPYHEGIAYLLGWSQELVGRSGEGMNGAAALTWNTLDAWARRTRRNPTPAECAALMDLDRVIRHPGNSTGEEQ